MKIIVTGGTGFLGKHVCTRLTNRGHTAIPISRSVHDLLIPGQAMRMMEAHGQPDAVIHLAARVAGIGPTSQRPADFLYDNLMMGMNVIHAAYVHDVQRVVVAGSVCAYPEKLPMPMRESSLWDGRPEPTNGGYGVAKRVIAEAVQAYSTQHGLNASCLLLANMYGPGDNFNEYSSHVIPALFRKFAEAKEKRLSHVTVWGTGEATRDFLYVEDAAKAIVLSAEGDTGPQPINIGSGHEVAIKVLAAMIRDIVGYQCEIKYDRTKPNGQPRRWLDTNRALSSLGWSAQTSLYDGLKRTYDWWQNG